MCNVTSEQLVCNIIIAFWEEPFRMQLPIQLLHAGSYKVIL